MSDAVYKKLFQIMSQDTALMMTKYDSKIDIELINDLYSNFIIDIADKEETGFITYLTLLIAFLEAKEDYRWCARLFDLKKRLIKYSNGEIGDTK